MTLGEAIRQAWFWTRPIPTTVAEVRALGSTYAGFGSRTPDDRWGVMVMFVGSTVRVSLTDHETVDAEGNSTVVDRREITAREFLDLVAEPQLTLFGADS